MENNERYAAVDVPVNGRIALGLSYRGAAFHGWQAQKSGLPTVQKSLEYAVSKVANHPVELVCAGRTDKGVHASQQIVHFDTPSMRSPRSWVFGCNANLPRDISIEWAGKVDEGFHARFSAISRRYHYVIYNHPIRPAIFSDEMSWFHYPLDAERMHDAAQCLVGEHDFTSFRAVGCQSRTPNRHVHFVNIKRYGHVIVMDIKGNAFLHHMVRNIAGVLMAIGSGRQEPGWCKEVLEARDRTKGGVTAPPYGLFLTHVEYPEPSPVPISDGPPALIHAMIAGQSAMAVSDAVWDISRPATGSL